jgi:hypothetical protein
VIDRRHDLSPWTFVREYLRPNRPVIVTDALAAWPAATRWSLAHFRERFGALTVALQGHWVKEERRSTFAAFIDSFDEYERADASAHDVVPYLRSTIYEGDDFTGAAFRALAADWARPAFLPAHGYVRPLALWSADPTRRRYPHFGIYLSPRGAVTRLHVDGGETDAVLCQLRGRKRAFLIAPHERPLLPDEDSRRPAHPATPGFAPDFGGAHPIDVTLEEGETLFIPRSWAHEVYTLSASISLTYNFLHLSNCVGWPGWRDVPRRAWRRVRRRIG